MRWIAFAALLLCLLPVPDALAQRLIYQQGENLFTASEEGKEGRKLFSIGNAPGTLWAASPDGRRIVWLTRPPAKSAEGTITGLADRPAVVRLSDLSGRHQKRLFATDKLRDRQNRPITLLGVPLSSTNGSNGTGSLSEWEPVSLSWSADSRTLYLSCSFLPNPVVKAMFAVDALTGIAVIDGEGRWKSLAPIATPEARGGLIVGCGSAQYQPETGEPIAYTPLFAVNLIEATRTPLFVPEKGIAELPEYAFASAPALAPENRAIVFNANNKALYTTDKFGKAYHRVVEGNGQRPRWSSDGKAILCLFPRALTGDKVVYDLVRIPLPESPADGTEAAPASPTSFVPVLSGVDWFDTVAE